MFKVNFRTAKQLVTFTDKSINSLFTSAGVVSTFQTNGFQCYRKSRKYHNGNYYRRKERDWSYKMLSVGLISGSAIALYIKNKTVLCHHRQEDDQIDKKWKNINITLYQYQTCPFSSKARYFLHAYNIPFTSVEVHPISKKEIKFSKYKKVPIVTIEKDGQTEQQLNDSSLIISILSSYMINENLTVSDILMRYPETSITEDNGENKTVILNKHWLVHDELELSEDNSKDPRSEESQWRQWADDYLVHLISPNVYRTFPEALQAFDYHVKQGRFKGTWEGIVAKYGGAVAMWAIAKKLKKKYKLKENVRIDLYEACNSWINAIGKHRKFMGGDKPNLADISVFGVLSVMENLDSFNDVLTHSRLKRWYYLTKKAIEDHDVQQLLLKNKFNSDI